MQLTSESDQLSGQNIKGIPELLNKEQIEKKNEKNLHFLKLHDVYRHCLETRTYKLISLNIIFINFAKETANLAY